MANVGDKYIIEIDEVFHGDVVPDTAIYEDHELYRIKGFNSLVFDENGLSKLEKYEESPFTQGDCDRARQEGYQEGYDAGIAQSCADNSHKCYIKGLNDAWEAATKIVLEGGKNDLSPEELKEIFKTCSLPGIFASNSAAEAISKIKAYEEQKKAEEESIKVGDEVELGDTRYIVVRVYNDTFEGIGACGADMGLCLSNFHKTGRHFSQIAEVLEKMKEGE